MLSYYIDDPALHIIVAAQQARSFICLALSVCCLYISAHTEHTHLHAAMHGKLARLICWLGGVYTKGSDPSIVSLAFYMLNTTFTHILRTHKVRHGEAYKDKS